MAHVNTNDIYIFGSGLGMMQLKGDYFFSWYTGTFILYSKLVKNWSVPWSKRKENMKLKFFVILFLCLSLITAGCITTPEPEKKSAPQWVNSVTLDEKYFYAVGISGPTRNIKDAWNQAIMRARA